MKMASNSLAAFFRRCCSVPFLRLSALYELSWAVDVEMLFKDELGLDGANFMGVFDDFNEIFWRDPHGVESID